MSKDADQRKRKRSQAENETPALFPGLDQNPDRQDLVDVVNRGTHEFTGELLQRDLELCRAVMTDLVSGLSGRAVARKHKVSRNSILSIEKIMRERGELPAIRAHVLGTLDDILVVGLESWKDAIIAGEISPGQLPIPLLAALDKKMQLEAGIVLGTGRTEKEITAADVSAAWSSLRQAKTPVEVGSGPSVDSQSTDQMPNAAPIASPSPLDVGLAAPVQSAPPIDVSFPPASIIPPHQPTDTPSPSSLDSLEGRGGGSANDAGGGQR